MAGRDAASDAINRLSARLTEDKDAQNERIDSIFDRLVLRFDRLEAKVDLKIDRLSDDTQRELDEGRRDIGELRDLVGKQITRIDNMEHNRDEHLRASAEGAAKGAGEAAGAVAATVAAVAAADRPKPFLESFWGRAVLIGTGVSAVAGAVSLIPKAVVVVSAFWAFLASLK